MGYLRGNDKDLRVITGAYEEQEVVDVGTGEVKSVLRNRVRIERSRSERYVTLRVTEGVDDLMSLSGLELRLLILVSMQCVSGLFVRKGYQNRVCPTGGAYSTLYASYLGCHRGSVSRALRSLEDKGVVLMMNNGSLLVNPDYVFTNGVRSYADDKARFEKYLLIRQRELGRQIGAGELLTTEEKESLFEKGGGK